MSMGHLDFMEYVIGDCIEAATTNDMISDIIGVLETTTMTAYDKRETIKEQE